MEISTIFAKKQHATHETYKNIPPFLPDARNGCNCNATSGTRRGFPHIGPFAGAAHTSNEPCNVMDIKQSGAGTFNPHRAVGCVTGLSFATAFALTEGLKWTVQRPRPYIAWPDELHPVRTTFGYSFPSGHTSLTFATATSLCLCYPKWYVIVPSVIWAAGVGFSRLYLGVHYPSDVLTGALIGTASAVLVYNLSKNWWQDSPQPVTAFAIPIVISF